MKSGAKPRALLEAMCLFGIALLVIQILGKTTTDDQTAMFIYFIEEDRETTLQPECGPFVSMTRAAVIPVALEQEP